MLLTLNQDIDNWLNCMEFFFWAHQGKIVWVDSFPGGHVIDDVQIVAWYSVVELTAAENKSFK